MKDFNISIVLTTTFLFTLFPNSFQKCCILKNPKFKKDLDVSNVFPGLVSVSWQGTLDNKECADGFEIFYWKTNSEIHSNNQKKSSNDRDGRVYISVIPGTQYTCQVKAKEPRGSVLCGPSETWSSSVAIETMEIGNLVFWQKACYHIF